MNERVFVIEDDENIQEIVKLALESSGYEITLFDNAIDAIVAIHENPPDLAIFDIMLPELDGISAIKKIRETNTSMPIMVLSAKDREIDKVRGLDSGCDDYMTKPFGVLELSARVRSLLRRTKKTVKVLETPTLKIDKAKHIVLLNDKRLELTHKEYQLLVYLVENRDRVVEREELLNSIWGYDFVGESRALDVHIRSLRAKLNDDGSKYIKTIRSVGYRYIEDKQE
ncbi:response regulator transcription factor [Intestinibaculum porci]|uniref:Alkaline phosphatase synthesis transcriptional regulatory protein PhoP n=1 Tax=Intestinibaculum porci TaxID=2487118 RepID=A0A3G9JMD7_9FIRM|nr:response regulator transcription factor [Intestinibaculum porci]MDD6350213.1 response regulator transcription factor [Intestinibaculum porci]MDD6422367.1 response regulator transcription factor [Intestinibaculum porci]BBH25368.1 alkaline phosphatase synthesis transcriptional regulatory protein PhoP [Intestinibaculum porci]